MGSGSENPEKVYLSEMVADYATLFYYYHYDPVLFADSEGRADNLVIELFKKRKDLLRNLANSEMSEARPLISRILGRELINPYAEEE